MLKITKNPHMSSFGMGRPNYRPIAQIGGMPGVRVGEYHPAASVDEVKKTIQKSLERSKK